MWDVLEPAVNAARSWLCFENIDDGVDRVVVAKGSNLACDATEWEGRRDEKEQDVEVRHTRDSVMCAKNTGICYVRREGTQVRVGLPRMAMTNVAKGSTVLGWLMVRSR